MTFDDIINNQIKTLKYLNMELKKKLLLLMLFVSFFGVSASASTQSASRRNVPLTMIYNNHEEQSGPGDDGKETLARRRTFFDLPELSIEDNTLYYSSSLSGHTIEFVQNGEVVYDDSFDSTGTYEIPEFLSGNIEIRIHVGDTTYMGVIDL